MYLRSGDPLELDMRRHGLKRFNKLLAADFSWKYLLMLLLVLNPITLYIISIHDPVKIHNLSLRSFTASAAIFQRPPMTGWSYDRYRSSCSSYGRSRATWARATGTMPPRSLRDWTRRRGSRPTVGRSPSTWARTRSIWWRGAIV